jgi:hypothetical protein
MRVFAEGDLRREERESGEGDHEPVIHDGT